MHLKTEGFDLKWEKGDKRNLYTFNGKDYGVPNRGTPEFLERPSLQKDFGMVMVGEGSKLLQVADQFDNVFLLDQTGGVVADVLSDVAHLDRINVAMRFVEKDRKEAASTRKVREKDMTELTHQLNEYVDLDDALVKVADASKKLNQITVVQNSVDSIDTYIEDLRALGFRVDSLKKACETPVPDFEPVRTKRGQYEKLARYQVEVTERATAVKSLLGVEIIQHPVTTALVAAANKYQQLSTWTGKLQSLQEQWTRFKDVSNVEAPDPSAIKAARDKLATLTDFAERMQKLDKTIYALEVDYAAAVSDEKVLADEVRALPFCPSCAQPVKIGHKHAERELA